jgi:hypothetical protein
MDQQISGEEHQRLHSTSSQQVRRNPAPVAVAIIVVLALMIISFFLGLQYEKKHAPKTATGVTNTSRGGLGSGGFGGGAGRGNRGDNVIGTVTAITSGSITVDNSFSGSSTTLSISSATTITDNDQSVTISDIQTGDKVLITKSSSTSTTATSIDVNPSFGGQGQAPTGGSIDQNSMDTNTNSSLIQ